MPKRQKMPAGKPSKKPIASDQPELPLDAGPASTAPAAATSIPKSNGAASDAPPDTQADTVPSRRKEGEKVQDEQAPLAQSYRNWFLDYASYVILDRAVPHIDDGLKPVQRRVLHTLWDMDDGRFHKVANVVGATMKLHPHGDDDATKELPGPLARTAGEGIAAFPCRVCICGGQ